jgi:hypothetical protein
MKHIQSYTLTQVFVQWLHQVLRLVIICILPSLQL